MSSTKLGVIELIAQYARPGEWSLLGRRVALNRRAGRALRVAPGSLAVVMILVMCGDVSAQRRPGSPADPSRIGWDAIRDGRNQDALTAFSEAIQTAPRDPALHLGAGLAAYLLGQTALARQSVERALTLAPNLTVASLLLADILYRESDLGSAILVYEAALKYAPQDDTLRTRLDRLRRDASVQRDFFQSQGAHFTVLFEGPADEEVARRALDRLEVAYYRIGTALYTFPERPITVVLYTQQQFRDVTRSPEWAAASYDGRIRVPMRGALDSPSELDRVLAHEFTHALVQAISPRAVPTWLNEGLAVVFEPTGTDWADATLAESSTRIGLSRLEGGFRGFTPGEARQAYAESAAAVRQMLDQAGSAAMVALLQDLARGVPLRESFEQRMLLPYDGFVASLELAR